MQRRAPNFAAGLLAVTALALAGCGGGSKASTTSGRASSDVTGSSLTALQTLGERALLVPDDVPGWSSHPPEAEAKEPPLEKEVAHCIGVPVSAIEDKPAEVHSHRFKRGEAEVSNDVTVSASTGEAAATFAAWARPAAPGCLAKGIQTALRKHLTAQAAEPSAFAFERPRVRSLALGRLPAAARAYRFDFVVRVGTNPLLLYFDAVLLRSNRVNATVTFGDQGKPVDSATERRLASLVAQRLGRVPAS